MPSKKKKSPQSPYPSHKRSTSLMDRQSLQQKLHEEAIAATDAREFETSLKLYDQCIVISDGIEDRLLKSILLNERSDSNFELSRFETALDDSKAAMSCLEGLDTEDGIESRRLALFLAGRAAYSMRYFNKALEYLQAAQDLRGSDALVLMLQNAHARLKEERLGIYNFEEMLENLMRNPNEPILNHASFISNTRIGTTATMGRGLFAAKDFQLGDLVLCEKAFAISFQDGALSDQLPVLQSQVLQTLQHSQIAKDKLYSLTDGEDAPARHPGQYDSPAQVNEIVALNAFEFFSVSTWHGMKIEEESGRQDFGEGTAAIWIRASLFNHSCIANVNRAHIGDMMVVRAMRPIKKGEELCLSYMDTAMELRDRRSFLEQGWKFECSCKRCEADSMLSHEQQDHRANLIRESEVFIRQLHADDDKEFKPQDIEKAKRLLRQLRLTYSNPAYRGMAHLPLIDLGRFLAESYLHTDTIKAEQTLISLFMDLGFVRETSQGGLVLDLAGARDMPEFSMGVALLAARMMHSKKLVVEKEVFLDMSEKLYGTLYGALCGFGEFVDPHDTYWLNCLDVEYR